jgi:hypothetical protein
MLGKRVPPEAALVGRYPKIGFSRVPVNRNVVIQVLSMRQQLRPASPHGHPAGRAFDPLADLGVHVQRGVRGSESS